MRCKSSTALKGGYSHPIHPRLLLRSLISSLFHDLFEIEQTQSCRCRNLLLISIARTAVGLARCVSAPEVKGVCGPLSSLCLVALWSYAPFTPPLRHRSVFRIYRCAEIILGANTPESVQIMYSDDMDHLGVLRDKIVRLRVEIADIQALNQQFRRDGGNGADIQVAHGQRSERLQAIQHELVQLADLGRRVVSTEQMKEKQRSRTHPVKQKPAA
jgi:hypothetical protein